MSESNSTGVPNLTPAELDELQAMCEAATPGEWRLSDHLLVPWVETKCGNATFTVAVPGNRSADKRADMALIAALRNAAPRLIAHAREAERNTPEEYLKVLAALGLPRFSNTTIVEAVRDLHQQLAAATQRAEAAETHVQRMKNSTQWDTVQTMSEQLGIAESSVRHLRADLGAARAELETAKSEAVRHKGIASSAMLGRAASRIRAGWYMADLDAARAQATALREIAGEALGYARHGARCQRRRMHSTSEEYNAALCDCGLDALRAKLGELT